MIRKLATTVRSLIVNLLRRASSRAAALGSSPDTGPSAPNKLACSAAAGRPMAFASVPVERQRPDLRRWHRRGHWRTFGTGTRLRDHVNSCVSAFTAMRSASDWSKESPESYPNTSGERERFATKVPCEWATSAAVGNKKAVPLDHCGRRPPAGSPFFCRMKFTIAARSIERATASRMRAFSAGARRGNKN